MFSNSITSIDVPSFIGREPPDAMNLPDLVGRPNLRYAVMSLRNFLNLCFKFFFTNFSTEWHERFLKYGKFLSIIINMVMLIRSTAHPTYYNIRTTTAVYFCIIWGLG